ncbi:hypothetical protein ACFVIX_14610 [Bacillus subtilis]|uniref:hypothetical protein n=1 Tax=Bacillus subtilis group TaxID=653685 RepID=UPI0005C9A1AF|nr:MULTISPECIES: hypothetical protein [Bacillus subtilis group]MCY8307184.1 hypothetical protein [Bacillus vallismortis]MCY8330770.1 hypothetical protein [Bacillus spizizenii]
MVKKKGEKKMATACKVEPVELEFHTEQQAKSFVDYVLNNKRASESAGVKAARELFANHKSAPIRKRKRGKDTL